MTSDSSPCGIPRGFAVLAVAAMALAAACGSDADVTAVAKMTGDSLRASEPGVPAPATATVTAPTESPTQSGAEESDKVDQTRRAGPIEGPYAVRIPQIGVAAPVVPIQVSADRVLVPPRELTVVGWWSEGAMPGAASGSAVLVGHSARAGGGVFDDVGDLQEGDSVEVEGSTGSLTYHVQSVEVVSKADLARNAEEIFDQTGPGRLVVITCEDFDGTSWRSNIVTIATPA